MAEPGTPALAAPAPRAALRGFLLALALTGGALALQPAPKPLDDLSADAWIYSAMAVRPEVFTARPWGYRILGPWLAAQLSPRRGFVFVTYGALVLTGGLLYLFLRRLGHGDWLPLLGAAAFGLSAPVAVATADPYLCEPLAALLETGVLLAAASGAGGGLVSLLMVLAVLAKEIQVVLLPLALVARRRRQPAEPWPRALLLAGLSAAPALLALLLLRAWWTPHLTSPTSGAGLDALPLAYERLAASLPRTGILLGGLTPLALLGAARAAARPYLRDYGWLAAAFVLLPFVAWTYDPRPGRLPFFGDTVTRLLLYAVPLLLPLALLALDRVLPHLRAPWPPMPGRAPRLLSVAAAGLAVLVAAWPLWGADRYRRVEITGALLGPVVRAICVQSVQAAERLEGGEEVVFDPGRGRIRWFLREGWGTFPFAEEGGLVMQQASARVLLPCLRPADLDLALTVSAPAEAALRLDVNGLELARGRVEATPRELAVRVPARALFRGDNLLGLQAGSLGARVRLHRVVIRPVGS